MNQLSTKAFLQMSKSEFSIISAIFPSFPIKKLFSAVLMHRKTNQAILEIQLTIYLHVPSRES